MQSRPILLTLGMFLILPLALALVACGSSSEKSPEPQTDQAMLQATIDTLQATVEAADSTSAVTQPASTAVAPSQAAPTLSPTSLPDTSEAYLGGSDDGSQALANRLVQFLSASEGEQFFSPHVMKADGTGLIDILAKMGLERGPWVTEWSPDGDHFVLWPQGQDAEVAYLGSLSDDHVIDLSQNIVGSNIRSIVWSVDGNRLLIQSNTTDGGVAMGDLLVVALDGQIIAKPVANARWWDYTPPDWSPDGQWIAITTDCSETGPCGFVVNADTGTLTNVNATLANNCVNQHTFWASAWAPNSTQLFAHVCAPENLYVIEPGSGQYLRLLSPDLMKQDARVVFASWSLDSSRIGIATYGTTSVDTYDLFIVNTDGNEITPVIQSIPNDEIAYQFSPNGQFLAYSFSAHADEKSEIYVLNLDNNEVTNLSQHIARDEYPYWSPDSRRVAFVSDRGGSLQIWIGDIQNNDVVKLTPFLAGEETFYSWSEDGRYILFQSNVEGDEEIYHVDVFDMSVTNLTNRPTAWDGKPSWLPQR